MGVFVYAYPRTAGHNEGPFMFPLLPPTPLSLPITPELTIDYPLLAEGGKTSLPARLMSG